MEPPVAYGFSSRKASPLRLRSFEPSSENLGFSRASFGPTKAVNWPGVMLFALRRWTNSHTRLNQRVPTADSPSQNGGAEIYNGTLAVKVRTLLYGSGLPATFWSAALLHSVYLHNRLVHSAVNMTPYEAWYGRRPDMTFLKTFGSRVCVRQSGTRRCKLDHHDFTGIFLGYTATDHFLPFPPDMSSQCCRRCRATPRITPPVGKTRRCHSTRPWPHTNSARTLPLLR
jgi:hypothetical protein